MFGGRLECSQVVIGNISRHMVSGFPPWLLDLGRGLSPKLKSYYSFEMKIEFGDDLTAKSRASY